MEASDAPYDVLVDVGDISKWRPPLDVVGTLKGWAMDSKDYFMSRQNVVWMMEKVTIILFAIHPATNFLVFLNLIKTNNPWWASFSAMTMILPHLILFVLYNAHTAPRNSFINSFGLRPTIPAFCYVNTRVVLMKLFGRSFERVIAHIPAFLTSKPYDECKASSETFMRLQRLSGTLGGSLWVTFQIYIVVRQHFLKIEVVNPVLLPVNVLLSLYTQYANVQFLNKYSKIVAGGSWKHFIETLLDLGTCSSSQMLLESINSSAKVVIDDNLRNLNARGIQSLANAIRHSAVAEEVEFKDTGIDWWTPDGQRCQEWQVKFCQAVSLNRKKLKSIRFTPEVTVPPDWTPGSYNNGWDFTHAGRLEKVMNGEKFQYLLDVSYPPSRLRDFIQANDREGTQWALAMYNPNRFRSKCPQKDHNLVPYTLPEGASGVCDYCRKEIPPCGQTFGCHREESNCNWDLCESCYSLAPSVENMALFACKCDSWRSLKVLLEDDPGRIQHKDLLKEAAGNMSGACLRLLLDLKANPDVNGSNGQTPLYAAAMGYETGVKLLLAAKADPQRRNSSGPGDYPLHHAATNNEAGVARLLLENKDNPADVNCTNNLGKTPLHFCASANSIGVAQVLLKNHADVTRLGVNRWTPLAVAGMHGSAEVLKELLKFKARAEGAYDGQDLLQVLRPRGENLGKSSRIYTCVELLEEAAANPDGHQHKPLLKKFFGDVFNLKKSKWVVTTPDEDERKEAEMSRAQKIVRHQLCRVVAPDETSPRWPMRLPDTQIFWVNRWPGARAGQSLLCAYLPSGKLYPPESRAWMSRNANFAQDSMVIQCPQGYTPGTCLKVVDPPGQTHYLALSDMIKPGDFFVFGFMPWRNFATQADLSKLLGCAPGRASFGPPADPSSPSIRASPPSFGGAPLSPTRGGEAAGEQNQAGRISGPAGGRPAARPPPAPARAGEAPHSWRADRFFGGKASEAADDGALVRSPDPKSIAQRPDIEQGVGEDDMPPWTPEPKTAMQRPDVESAEKAAQPGARQPSAWNGGEGKIKPDIGAEKQLEEGGKIDGNKRGLFQDGGRQERMLRLHEVFDEMGKGEQIDRLERLHAAYDNLDKRLISVDDRIRKIARAGQDADEKEGPHATPPSTKSLASTASASSPFLGGRMSAQSPSSTSTAGSPSVGGRMSAKSFMSAIPAISTYAGKVER